MTRPFTLFTGQWADLPFEEVARLAGSWGFDGLEIACWGDHLDASRWDDADYVAGRREILERNGLGVWAIANHLLGQAVSDPIDRRHQAVVPPDVWGDGDPKGVQQRAAEKMKDTARAAARLGVDVVTGFSRPAVWHMLYLFPPHDWEEVERGYEHGFTHQVVDLVTAVAKDADPAPSFADGLQVQRVLDAVERSAANDSTFTAI